MPVGISEEILARVKDIWAEDQDRSGRAIHRLYHRRFTGRISVRKVQESLLAWRDEAPQQPFPLAEWVPWASGSESPEDSAFLLRLNAQSVQLHQRGLYLHEARWGCRLRVALDGAEIIDQLAFIRGYAQRQVIGYNLREDIYTAHLDGIVAYRAWLPEAAHQYALAVVYGHAPLPIPVRVKPKDYPAFLNAVGDYLDAPDAQPAEDYLQALTYGLLSQVSEVWNKQQAELDVVEATIRREVR